MGHSDHTATWMLNGQVLLAGGFINTQSDLTGFAELYDPGSATFSATGAMAGPRVNHTATLLADGRVLMVGVPACLTLSPRPNCTIPQLAVSALPGI